MKSNPTTIMLLGILIAVQVTTIGLILFKVNEINENIHDLQTRALQQEDLYEAVGKSGSNIDSKIDSISRTLDRFYNSVSQ